MLALQWRKGATSQGMWASQVRLTLKELTSGPHLLADSTLHSWATSSSLKKELGEKHITMPTILLLEMV